MLNAYPNLNNMYDKSDVNLEVLYVMMAHPCVKFAVSFKKSIFDEKDLNYTYNLC